MKPGSLVVYIGGLTQWDIAAGCDLSPDVIYQVDKIGDPPMNDPIFYLQAQGQKVLSLVERPNESYLFRIFREVQPPDEINLEELMSECISKPDEKVHVNKSQKV